MITDEILFESIANRYEDSTSNRKALKDDALFTEAGYRHQPCRVKNSIDIRATKVPTMRLFILLAAAPNPSAAATTAMKPNEASTIPTAKPDLE